MRRALVLGAAAILLLVTALVYVGTTKFGSGGSSDRSAPTFAVEQNLSGGVNYLLDNYNPRLGLISETPNSSVYWLYSDNFLAGLALAQYGSNNRTVSTAAANTSVSLNVYLPVGSTINQYTTLEIGPCVYQSTRNYTVAISGKDQIRAGVNNGTESLNDGQYAGIAFLDAICSYHNDDMPAAVAAYDRGARMFDGAGLRDLPYSQTHQYQTYELALLIYASVVLGQPVSSAVLSALLRMQAPTGGFYTGYDVGYSHGSTETNTETASLAVLALQALESEQ